MISKHKKRGGPCESVVSAPKKERRSTISHWSHRDMGTELDDETGNVCCRARQHRSQGRCLTLIH